MLIIGNNTSRNNDSNNVGMITAINTNRNDIHDGYNHTSNNSKNIVSGFCIAIYSPI